MQSIDTYMGSIINFLQQQDFVKAFSDAQRQIFQQERDAQDREGRLRQAAIAKAEKEASR